MEAFRKKNVLLTRGRFQPFTRCLLAPAWLTASASHPSTQLHHT